MVIKSKKPAYFEKLMDLIRTNPKFLLISVDFVGSKQMQEIRMALRGKATILMGKNTMIRTCLRNHAQEDESLGLDELVKVINGNIGFVFVHDGDLEGARQVCLENRKPAAAKAGVLSPADVVLPAGPTGLDPSSTNFFQALNIPTKIVKGAVELVANQVVCKAGAKVSASEAVLLGKMGIKPFEYGMKITHVYDGGSVFESAVLDITDDVIQTKFLNGARNIAAISREIGVPTEASLPHMVSNALKNMASLCAEIDFEFEEIAKLKAFLKDPSAFASAAPAASASAAPAAAAVAAPVVEEEEEEMEFDLF